MTNSPTTENSLTKDKELHESIKKDNHDCTLATEANAAFLPTESSATSNEKEVTMVPKLSRTPWMCYLRHLDIRKSAKESNPDVKMTELTKIISIQWKALDKEGQQPYIDLANEEKQALLENPQMVAKKKKKKKMTETMTETTETNTNLLVQPTTEVIDVSTLLQEIKELRAMVEMLTEKVASRDKPSVNNEPSYEDGYFSGDSSS